MWWFVYGNSTFLCWRGRIPYMFGGHTYFETTQWNNVGRGNWHMLCTLVRMYSIYQMSRVAVSKASNGWNTLFTRVSTRLGGVERFKQDIHMACPEYHTVLVSMLWNMITLVVYRRSRDTLPIYPNAMPVTRPTVPSTSLAYIQTACDANTAHR